MKALVLDDDENFLEMISKELNQLFNAESTVAEIYSTSSVAQFEKELLKGIPDVVFLDIEMPEKWGIEVAEELRSVHQEIDIIFLTNREDLVFQSIHYSPFRFIRKSRIHEELKEAVDAYIEFYKEKNAVYDFYIMGEAVPVPVGSISYIESSGHSVEIHTETEILRVRYSIGKLEEELRQYYFIRIQRGFLVNLKYVKKVTGKSVKMSDGAELTIKRGGMEEIRETFYQYRRKSFNGANKQY